MRLEGPDSIAELVREDWAKYQGKKSAGRTLGKFILPTKIFSLEICSANWGLGGWYPHSSLAVSPLGDLGKYLCSVWLIGGTWIIPQLDIPGTLDASQLLHFFPLHTSGHSAEESCITEALEAQVRSKSWCWGVSKPFLQTWHFCWQTFCSCPVLQSLNLFLSIYWEKGFLAEEKRRINVWWNNEGAGEAALSQRAVGVCYSLWAQPDFCLCSSSGSSWIRASRSALQLMETHLLVLDLGLPQCLHGW